MKPESKVGAPWDGDPADPAEAFAKRQALEKLREKFPPASVGKLPRATSKDAKPGRCRECGGWHKLPAVHLDYVGHSQVTDRLLTADPYWDWSPLAFDEHGMPRFLINGDGDPIGLWIKLTVCGVTRLGFGSVEGGAFDPEKQLIGDALRNAAMRFGVALDLWSKNELESNVDVDAPTTSAQVVAAAIADPVWDPKPQTPDGQAGLPLAADRNSTKQPRIIRGVPITVPETWDWIRVLQIKGKGPYSKLTWAEVDTQPDPSPFTEWLEKGVAEILLDHNKAIDAGRKNVPLPAAQRALIAWQRLLDRRAGITETPSICPLTEEEMAAADRAAEMEPS